VLPNYPGTGTVLGSPVIVGQRENFWTGSTALRSAWSAHWTSEIRFGMSAGNVVFSDAIQPPLFAQWRGYAPIFNSAANPYISNPYNRSTSSRRNNPVQQLMGNATWSHGSHLLNMGGSFSRINEVAGGLQHSEHSTHHVRDRHQRPGEYRRHQHLHRRQFPQQQRCRPDQRGRLIRLADRRVSSTTQTAVLSEKTHQ
jgi:hypothetical protein